MKWEIFYISLFAEMIKEAIIDFIIYSLYKNKKFHFDISKDKGKKIYVQNKIIENGKSAFYFLFGGWMDAWIESSGLYSIMNSDAIREYTLKTTYEWNKKIKKKSHYKVISEIFKSIRINDKRWRQKIK